jgi:hypothetical protein
MRIKDACLPSCYEAVSQAEVAMSGDMDAPYFFRRAREEAAKANNALARHAPAQEVAAHQELALRYKVRALAAASSPDQVLHDAMENFEMPGDAGTEKRTH